MREYGQVQTSFWTDPDIQSLSDQGKLLANYLLTGPHSNGLGCYRLPDGYLQADFGWTPERVSKGFAELFAIGFCERCETTFFVVIPKFLKWNPITNGNVATARIKEFDSIPKKASVHSTLCESMKRYGNHLPNPFINRLETLSKGYGKQDPTLPDPEPDPEQEPEPTKPKPKQGAALAPPAAVILDGLNVDAWDEYQRYRSKAKLKKLQPASVDQQQRWLIEQGDERTQAEIVSRTIRNGWSGLFELKQGGSTGSTRPKVNPRALEGMQ